MNKRKSKSGQNRGRTKKRATSASAKAAAENMPEITSDALFGMIAERAYLKAEKRGFQGGSPKDDWLEAEAESDGMFKAPGTHKRKVRDCAQKERRRRRHSQKIS